MKSALPFDNRLIWVNFDSSMVCNHIHSKLWDEITNPFSNFNGCGLGIYKWFHSTLGWNDLSMMGSKLIHISKSGPWWRKWSSVTCFIIDSHHTDVKMSAMGSQITSLPIVYSIVYCGADQRKHQSSASLAFVRGIHRWPVNSPHKRLVTRIMLPFDDVIIQVMGRQRFGAKPLFESMQTCCRLHP